MKKWIRIKGVALFVVITITITLFALLFADTLIKKAIETTGTLIVGAEVELAEADLTLFPVGITLTGLEITNPEAPMTNALEVERIVLSMETAPLLFGKIIVPEMSATGIRLDTPRSRSGAVIERQKQATASADIEPKGKGLSLPSLDIEEPKKILEQEKLASVEEAKQIQADIEKLKIAYKEQIATLPDKDDFNAYKKRIRELKGGKFDWRALLTKASDLKKITAEVERELKAIKTVRTELKKDIARLKSRIKALPKLAKADYKRLKMKYGPSAPGLDKITALLFGDAYGGKVETAITWYRKIVPLLEKSEADEAAAPVKKGGEEAKVKRIRGEGIDIAFREKRPLPDFLISKGQLQLEIPAGTLSGTIENITAQQPLVGRPMAFTLSGKKLKGIDAVEITATIDRVNPGTVRDHLTFSGRGIAIKPVGSDDFIRMEEAFAAVRGEADITFTNTLDANLAATLSGVRFAAATDGGKLRQAIGRSLAEVKTFSIQGTARGTLSDYDLSVDSDLDTLIGKALKKTTKELTAQFDRELKEAIKEKTGASFSAVGTDLNDIIAMDGDLAKKLQDGKSLL